MVLKNDSGFYQTWKCIVNNNKLTSFLYSLMRDYILPGTLEKLVQEEEKITTEIIYSNKHLAAYAEEISKRLLFPNAYKYNENFGDDKLCKCGHPYDRHFDSYDNMSPVGCKYCYKYEDHYSYKHSCPKFEQMTDEFKNTIKKCINGHLIADRFDYCNYDCDLK